MSALSDAPCVWMTRANNKIPKSAPSEESYLSLQPTPQQFEDEWVAKGDPHMGVFKCFSYNHSSYVS